MTKEETVGKNFTVPVMVVVLWGPGCDVANDEAAERDSKLSQHDDAGTEDAEPVEFGTSGDAAQAVHDAEPEAESEHPPAAPEPVFQSEVAPQEGGPGPACDGIYSDTIAAAPFGCTWERLDDSTGFDAQATCSANYFALSGTCYAANASHRLVRSYATESTFNLVNDGTGLTGVDGWACEWDTNATSNANRHIVAALCCPLMKAARC